MNDRTKQYCCCPVVPTEPCGCPPGTIRASLALSSTLIILLGLIALVIVLVVNQQWALAGTVANGPTAILSAIISYYFASRTAQNTQGKKDDPPHLPGDESEKLFVRRNVAGTDEVEVIGGI